MTLDGSETAARGGAPDPGRWGDLATRVVSAVVLLAVGAAGIWAGGVWFRLMVMAAVGVMVWELAVMQRASRRVALLLGIGGGVALGLLALPTGIAPTDVSSGISPWLGTLLLLPIAALGAVLLPNEQASSHPIFAAYGAAILLTGYTLVLIEGLLGTQSLMWFLAVVVVTDVFGYFGGRLIGGPKFWPRVSPKKTWAGVIAGWVAAGVIGLLFSLGDTQAWIVVVVSILLSFGSQMGDISESAIKRRAGIKDSSALIPGHGGFLDRFDGVIGAAVLFLIAILVLLFSALGAWNNYTF